MHTRITQGDIWSGRRSAQEVDIRVRRALLDLKGALREMYGDRFRGLFLYGSYARGDANPDSDVDTILALSGPVNPIAEMNRLSRLLSDLSLRHDLLLTTYPVPELWLTERHSPLFDNIRREAVSL